MKATPQFIDLVTRSHEYLTERQRDLRKDFRLDDWPRYDWDQETAQLVFSADAVPKVVADIQFVGSISTVSGTWLWSWGNPSLRPELARDIEAVRAYGEKHGIPHLTTSKWQADEVDGWEMTAVAAYILQTKGAYRTPNEGGFTYNGDVVSSLVRMTWRPKAASTLRQSSGVHRVGSRTCLAAF